MTTGQSLQTQEHFAEVTEIPHGAQLPDTGLMQTKSPYSTAVQVIKQRNLNIVESKCLEEAAIAGDDFYYSWSQGGQVTEGLTVGAALAIARNMWNNAVDVEVRETPHAYYFTGAYIDLETGFNIRRTFRQNKQSPRTKQGKEIYSGERGQDVIYQIGQSKAIRNVVLNAVPNWLGRKVFERAKENVVAKIENMGVEKAKGILQRKAEALGIPLERVIANFGKVEEWDVEKIVRITGAVRSIEDGRERVDDVFPPTASENPVNAVAEKAKEALARNTKKPAEEFGTTATKVLLERLSTSKTKQEFAGIDKERERLLGEGQITEAQSQTILLAMETKEGGKA